eukprot:GHUV01017035.1.p1 GENE.GHUV01017035.1~~GHUV01017035.1.p1  ORF type:complete len:156 (-),score=39.34 GHUV01017035.1:1895-2362(-)
MPRCLLACQSQQQVMSGGFQVAILCTSSLHEPRLCKWLEQPTPSSCCRAKHAPATPIEGMHCALLQVLDEPAAVQSDPTLLNLQLRQVSKDTPGVRMDVVGRIEHSDKDRKQRLAAWISSIGELHKNKPSAAVRYSKPMPDLEVLMQASDADGMC